MRVSVPNEKTRLTASIGGTVPKPNAVIAGMESPKMPNPLAKIYDCDREGCAGNASHILFLETYEKYKFFSCSHDVDAMKAVLQPYADTFKVKLRVEPIKDITFIIGGQIIKP